MTLKAPMVEESMKDEPAILHGWIARRLQPVVIQ